ncbi:hypothetical protein Fmac_026598 [Flemingia macrophylla]|uniref:Uncharacterized protein n=1 Tax=Flemingia macrophylla TaxID=520843 RepID=A0ABD1LFB1_9FABA
MTSERRRSMSRLGAERARRGSGHFLDWATAGPRVFFQVSDPRSPSLGLSLSSPSSSPCFGTFIFSLFRPLDSLPLSVSPSGKSLSGDDSSSGDPSYLKQKSFIHSIGVLATELQPLVLDWLSLVKFLDNKGSTVAALLYAKQLRYSLPSSNNHK